MFDSEALDFADVSIGGGGDEVAGRSNGILLARTDVPNVCARFATVLLTGGELGVLVSTNA